MRGDTEMVKRIFLISLFILAPLVADTQAMARTPKKNQEQVIVIGRDINEKNIPLDVGNLRWAMKKTFENENIEGYFLDHIMDVELPYSMKDLFGTCIKAVRDYQNYYGYDEGSIYEKTRCMDFVERYMRSIYEGRFITSSTGEKIRVLPNYTLDFEAN